MRNTFKQPESYDPSIQATQRKSWKVASSVSYGGTPISICCYVQSMIHLSQLPSIQLVTTKG